MAVLFSLIRPTTLPDQQKFYSTVFETSDHTRLAECLKRNSDRLLFLLTYDDHPDIRRLYKWCYSIIGQQWNYTINRTDDQRNGLKRSDGFKRRRDKGSELFIRNYDIFLPF